MLTTQRGTCASGGEDHRKKRALPEVQQLVSISRLAIDRYRPLVRLSSSDEARSEGNHRCRMPLSVLSLSRRDKPSPLRNDRCLPCSEIHLKMVGSGGGVDQPAEMPPATSLLCHTVARLPSQQAPRNDDAAARCTPCPTRWRATNNPARLQTTYAENRYRVGRRASAGRSRVNRREEALRKETTTPTGSTEETDCAAFFPLSAPDLPRCAALRSLRESYLALPTYRIVG